jgi:hypothetical protein
MSRMLISKTDRVRQKDETVWRGDYRMSGADQALARQPEIVAFLGKCYAETVNERRDWPVFNAKRLGQFLAAAGVDLEAAIKADADAMVIPDELADPAICFAKFQGLSFLTQPAMDTCLVLRHQYRQAHSRRGAPAA